MFLNNNWFSPCDSGRARLAAASLAFIEAILCLLRLSSNDVSSSTSSSKAKELFSTKEEHQKEALTGKEEAYDIIIANESKVISKHSNAQAFEDDSCELREEFIL